MLYPIGIQTFESSRGYAREYTADPRKVFLIGCNFSTDSGTIDDWLAVESD